MTTQAIQSLLNKTHAIQGAALHFQGTANAALADKFASEGEELPDGVQIPDWETLQTFIAARLELERQKLREAAEKHGRELDDDPRKRVEREKVVQEVYDRFVGVRHLLRQAVGKERTYELLGVRGRTPERPHTLLTYLQLAVMTLRDPKRRPDALNLPAVSLDWDELADALWSDARRLEEVLNLQRRDQLRANRALHHKDQAQASANDTYVGFTKILEGMYIAAGKRKLAARLRPTVRKKSRAQAEEPVEATNEKATEETAETGKNLPQPTTEPKVPERVARKIVPITSSPASPAGPRHPAPGLPAVASRSARPSSALAGSGSRSAGRSPRS